MRLFMADFKMNTTIDNLSFPFKIKYADHILSLGSCFSVEIGQILNELKYPILINPAGITFNPASIYYTLKRVFVADPLPEQELFLTQGHWAHYDFHSIFNQESAQKYIEKTNNSLKEAFKEIKKTNVIILTLGTAFVFRLKSNGHIVNNCHKMPNDLFLREQLSSKEILSYLNMSKELLDTNLKNDYHLILTLSPVRHIRDGLVENQKSKAHCLVAIHQFVDAHENAHYFPSYEIVLDDLRDYRFYKRDLIHPTKLAVEYVFNQFEKALLFEEETPLRERIRGINQSLNHRPFNPNSDSHLKFIRKLNGDIESLNKEYPNLSFKF